VIVLDASAALDWLLRTPEGLKIEKRIFARPQNVHAPHLLDLEVAQVLRKLAGNGTISPLRAESALQDLVDARVMRHPHRPFLPRVWQLRHNLTSYDAVYVALAELLNAPLLTRDRKLGTASGHSARIELV